MGRTPGNSDMWRLDEKIMYIISECSNENINLIENSKSFGIW